MFKAIQAAAMGHVWQNAVMPQYEAFTTPHWPSLYVNHMIVQLALTTILLRRPETSWLQPSIITKMTNLCKTKLLGKEE